jgi:hypothetical protein
VFTGTLSIGGTQFMTVVVQQTATTSIKLASLRLAGTTTTVSVPVSIQLGTLSSDGLTCSSTTSVTVTPALTNQINQQLIAGTYCVAIVDAGSLTGDLDFAVRIDQAANTSALGTPGTETFSSNLYPSGTAMRTFAASQSGNISVSVTSVTPAAAIGLGLGVPNTDSSDCAFTTTLTTTAGSGNSINATADAGTYCVKVFDAAGLRDRVLFSVQITHQ